MTEAGLLAGLELVVQLVLVLVHVLQEVQSQGRREWMRKIGVDHNRWGRSLSRDVSGGISQTTRGVEEFHLLVCIDDGDRCQRSSPSSNI